MAKVTKNTRKFRAWLVSSIYTFPILLVIVLLLLTALKINGSSTSIYNSFLGDGQKSNSGLVLGHPRSIRSDEYISSTPLTALQYQTNFPTFSHSLGSGRDVALSPDLPVINWVSVFRPQNWSFFVMPFENGFAFRWWLSPVLLITASYFFLMKMLNRNKKLSILLSLAFGLSPFFLWWYQSTLFIPMAYAFMMMILAIRIIDQEKIPRLKSMALTNSLYVLGLAYLGSSFVLLLYAPFLIPIFLAVAIFSSGLLLNRRFTDHSITSRQALQRLGLMLLPIIFVVPVVLLFVQGHKDMIQALANSVYPGHRLTASGHLPFPRLYRFFDGFLQPLLQRPPVGRFYTNQSESANFILLLPFLLIPGFILQAYDYLKRRRINWIFLLVQSLSVLFILRITVPAGDGFYKLLLLNRVPNNRLMAGVGLLGFLQLILLIKYLPSVKFPKKLWAVIASAASLLTFVWLLIFSKHFFKAYLTPKYDWVVLGLTIFFTAIIAAFLFRKKILGACLLLAFTVVSSFSIIPLQRGLPFIDHSRIVNSIKAVSKPSDSWAVVDNFTFETLPWMAGRKMISGPQIYTDLKFWRQIDPDGKLENIYNRQAHAIFVSNSAKPDRFLPADFTQKMTENLKLVRGSVYQVRFTCSNFVYKNVNFVLATHDLKMSCLAPIDSVAYPRATFYIYKVSVPR